MVPLSRIRPVGEAGHLGGFAANKSAMVPCAAAGKAGDDLREDARLEFAGADVIQEEERFSAEDGDVIHAMVDEVLANGVMAVESEGELELGADSVGAGDEDGLAVFFHIEGEEAAEAAKLAEDLGTVRGGQELGEGGLDAVAEINVHTRASISFYIHQEDYEMGRRRAVN